MVIFNRKHIDFLHKKKVQDILDLPTLVNQEFSVGFVGAHLNPLRQTWTCVLVLGSSVEGAQRFLKPLLFWGVNSKCTDCSLFGIVWHSTWTLLKCTCKLLDSAPVSNLWSSCSWSSIRFQNLPTYEKPRPPNPFVLLWCKEILIC